MFQASMKAHALSIADAITYGMSTASAIALAVAVAVAVAI